MKTNNGRLDQRNNLLFRFCRDEILLIAKCSGVIPIPNQTLFQAILKISCSCMPLTVVISLKILHQHITRLKDAF